MSFFHKYLRNLPFTTEDKAEALADYRQLSTIELWQTRRELRDEWNKMKENFIGLRPDESHGNHLQEYRMRSIEIQSRLLDLVLNERGAHSTDAPNEVGASSEVLVANTEALLHQDTVKSGSRMDKRASWLKERLLERGWSNSDPSRWGGPDRKTIEKIFRGEAVRNDVLEKLANALSQKNATVNVLDIPRD